jgi:ankyrin repeat protein
MGLLQDIARAFGVKVMTPEESKEFRRRIGEAIKARMMEEEEERKAREKDKMSAKQAEINNLLNKASQQGDQMKIKQLLAQGADPAAQSKEKGEKGTTALHEIIKALNNPKVVHIDAIVEQFLTGEKKATLLNAKDKLGRTALHIAVSIGEKAVSITKKLIAEGASLVIIDHNGNTPLHTACAASSNNASNIQLLLKRQSNIINAINGSGETPLQLAIANNREKEVIQALVKYGANVNEVIPGEQQLRLIHLAALNAQTHIIDALYDSDKLEVDAEDIEGFTAFHRVIELWSSGHDITKLNWLEKHFKLASTLKPNSKKDTWENVASNLRKKGANVNTATKKTKNTPLHTVSESLHRDDVLPIVRFLLTNGAKKESNNIDGNSPFQYGVGWGLKPEILKELMKVSAAPDANMINKYRDTPLQYAVLLKDEERRNEILDFLLPYNPNPNFPNVLSITPIRLVKTLLATPSARATPLASLNMAERTNLQNVRSKLQTEFHLQAYVNATEYRTMPVLVFNTNRVDHLPDWFIKPVTESEEYSQAIRAMNSEVFSDTSYISMTDTDDGFYRLEPTRTIRR